MHYAVQCYEEVPFSSLEKMDAAQARVNPRLRQAMDNNALFEDC
jgi:hypothetical protein